MGNSSFMVIWLVNDVFRLMSRCVFLVWFMALSGVCQNWWFSVLVTSGWVQMSWVGSNEVWEIFWFLNSNVVPYISAVFAAHTLHAVKGFNIAILGGSCDEVWTVLFNTIVWGSVCCRPKHCYDWQSRTLDWLEQRWFMFVGDPSRAKHCTPFQQFATNKSVRPVRSWMQLGSMLPTVSRVCRISNLRAQFGVETSASDQVFESMLFSCGFRTLLWHCPWWFPSVPELQQSMSAFACGEFKRC